MNERFWQFFAVIGLLLASAGNAVAATDWQRFSGAPVTKDQVIRYLQTGADKASGNWRVSPRDLDKEIEDVLQARGITLDARDAVMRADVECLAWRSGDYTLRRVKMYSGGVQGWGSWLRASYGGCENVLTLNGEPFMSLFCANTMWRGGRAPQVGPPASAIPYGEPAYREPPRQETRVVYWDRPVVQERVVFVQAAPARDYTPLWAAGIRAAGEVVAAHVGRTEISLPQAQTLYGSVYRDNYRNNGSCYETGSCDRRARAVDRGFPVNPAQPVSPGDGFTGFPVNPDQPANPAQPGGRVARW